MPADRIRPRSRIMACEKLKFCEKTFEKFCVLRIKKNSSHDTIYFNLSVGSNYNPFRQRGRILYSDSKPKNIERTKCIENKFKENKVTAFDAPTSSYEIMTDF